MFKASTTTTTANPQSEQETTRQRVLTIASWLVNGGLRPEAVSAAMQEWNLSRRTAQVYVRKAANRIGRLTEFDDPLFALKLSQLQRDRLVQQVQSLRSEYGNMDPVEFRDQLKAISTQLKILTERDRTAAKIAQLEAKLGRAEPRGRHMPAPTPMPVEQPQEALEEAKPARPETMRSAAQRTGPRPAPTQPKVKPGTDLSPEIEPTTAPAPGAETCASETMRLAQSAGEAPRACASGLRERAKSG